MKKYFLFAIVLTLLISSLGYYYIFIFSKNRKFDMKNASAIEVDANALVKSFQENESKSNALYLDKVLLISGTVIAVGENQTNERTITIGSQDPFSGVMVTLDSNETATVKINEGVKLKGFCKGYLSDVIITEAIFQN